LLQFQNAGNIRILIFLGSLIILFTSASTTELLSKTPSSPDADQQLRFHSFTVKDGLSYYKVRVMTQDPYGFMWFGSDYGVERFDGQNITSFKHDPENINSLPFGTVTCLLSQAEQDRIWVATRGGLCHIDVKTFQIQRIDLGPYNSIRTIAWDRNNGLWIGTHAGGLLYYDFSSLDYKVYNSNSSNVSHDQIRSIYEDSSGNLWVGTLDKLNMMEKNSGVFNSFDLKGDSDLSIENNLILEIIPYSAQSDSLLWIGTETGLCLFNRYTKTHEVYRKGRGNVISNDKVTAMFMVDSRKIWVGTDFGLNLFDTQSETSQVYYHIPSQQGSLSNNKIYSIYEDNAGNLWFATDNGVSLLENSKKAFVFHPVRNVIEGQAVGIEVNSIIADRIGHYWLGTHQGVMGFSTKQGIFKRLRHQQDDPMSLLADKSLDLYIDEYEKLWIATNKGINVWDPGQFKMHSFPADFQSGTGLKSQFTNSLLRAHNGSLWVGTWDGGIHKVEGDLGDMNSITIRPVSDFDDIDYVASDPDALWIVDGTELYRLDLLTEQTERIEAIKDVVYGSDIQSMFYSNKGSLWMGTENGLLEYIIHKDTARYYPIQSGKELSIINLLEDNHGNIWCSSVTELIKFDVDSGRFEIFPIGKEIPLSGFRPRSCYKSGNGKLVFAGQDGFIEFDPDEVSLSGYQPEIGISELYIQNERVIPGKILNGQQILGQSIFFEEEITLRYNHRSLMFGFASLHYGDLSGKIFAYKLDGYDEVWKYTSGDQSSAVYSNLPTGKYTLLLRGSNNDGVMSPHVHSLKLRIKPPPGASPGFIAIYIVVALVLLFLILYVYRIKQKWLTRLEKIRIEKEQNENMAQLKQRLFTNISHEFRTPLGLISGPTNEILEKNTIDPDNRRLVEIISRNTQRLLRLVNQLIDFRKMEVGNVRLQESTLDVVKFCSQVYEQFSDLAERKKIEYTFCTDVQKLVSSFDPGKLETVLFNLLSNAFNHTPEHGKISIEVDKEDGKGDKYPHGVIIIRVKDTGPGIASKEQRRIFDRFYQSGNGNGVGTGSGIGLTMVKEYVKMHGGKVTVKSAPDKGSSFKVRIPVRPGDPEVAIADPVQVKPLFVDQNAEVSPVETGRTKNFVFPGNPVILLVEDNPEVIDFIKLGLAEKYNFRHAENGKVALEMVEQEIPDLILSDVMMPEMDGYTLCSTIRENPKTNHIPFILLSALALTDQQIEGIKCGADAYLTKPFIIKYLDALIENLFHRKELLVEYARMQTILNPAEINVTSTEEKILKQVITFIESHISDPELSVERICQATGFTHSYLYRTIKRITGGTLNELIKDIRIKRAAQLLKTRKLTIAEVMVEVGFSNHSYFSKCFRKEFGMSPGGFIESLSQLPTY